MTPEIDLAIKLATFLGLLGSAALILFKIGRLTGQFEAAHVQQAGDIAALKTSIEKIGALMTEVAVQKQQLDTLSKRQDLLDKRYEDLRRGDGYIKP